jgi:glutamate-ammonia-ligase adenylyltransferase
MVGLDEADALREFTARMGSDYAACHPAEEIAVHLRLACELSRSRPARLRIVPVPGGRLEVTVVALDFFGEFALLCGVLSAVGLNIESGHIHTGALPEKRATTKPDRRRPPRRRPTAARGLPSERIIVDEFRVAPQGPDPSAELSSLESRLEADVLDLLGLVEGNRADEARSQLDRRLAERFSRDEPPAAALDPLEIDLDNVSDPRWTRMEVRGRDTPGFLYALATALAARDISVQQVEIASVGGEARDLFLVADRDGQKLSDPARLATLRAAVALLKQFAHLLPLAPDPALAIRSFSQLVDDVLAGASRPDLSLVSSPQGLRELARLLGSSTFLWEDFLRLQTEHLLPVLSAWRRRPLRTRQELIADFDRRLAAAGTFDEKRRALNELKDEEMLLADMAHLVDPETDILAFSRSITDLAEAVIGTALRASLEEAERVHGVARDAEGRACPIAVVGLGKLGGREMGYASDIELIFVYGSPGRTERTGEDAGVFFDEVTRQFVGMIAARQEGIFHVDLRLRPYGAKGPLATPLSALQDYYRPRGSAAPFERQALIKLRRVAGDEALGAEVERVRDSFVWSDEPWNSRDALHLRERQVRELVEPGRFSVKYSPGALVEVEYAVQYMQLEHGRSDPRLRTPSTLEGIERLREAGLLDPGERQMLRSADLFWRAVADALRMVRGAARDLLLPASASEEVRFLARRLGYVGPDWATAAGAFLDDVARHRESVARFFRGRFRP